VRFLAGGEFLPLTGGTLTGPLTVSANAGVMLTLNRPDGAAYHAIDARAADVTMHGLHVGVVEPVYSVIDAAAAPVLTINTATGAVATVGSLTVSSDVSPAIAIDRPAGGNGDALEASIAGLRKWALRVVSNEPRFVLRGNAAADRLTMDGSNGLLGTGLVPLGMMQRDEASGENAGVVTVLAGATTIVDVATAVSVAIGDRVHVRAVVSIDKGATAGLTALILSQAAGTATGVWTHNASNTGIQYDTAASLTHLLQANGIFRVTGAGSLTIGLAATSAGSNSSVPAGFGELHVRTLRAGA
jgi:hypothetical protein